jgi:hypothetical protein
MLGLMREDSRRYQRNETRVAILEQEGFALRLGTPHLDVAESPVSARRIIAGLLSQQVNDLPVGKLQLLFEPPI